MIRTLLALAVCSLIIPAAAQHKETVARIKAEVAALCDDPAVKGGHVGFSLRSPDGTVLAGFNQDKSLTPASNLKVITTATALKVLGENFRFETQLLYRGTIREGVLKGDLIVRGSGDPSLGSERIPGNLSSDNLFKDWTDKIRAAGIRKIEGTIIQDYSAFDKNIQPDGWIWADMGNYYGAGASGLNINENTYAVFFKPGMKEGDTTSVLRTEPSIPGIVFENKVLTGAAGSGDNGYIYGSPYSNYRYLSGTIPAGVKEFSIKGSIPDPAFYCVYRFYNVLEASGIDVSNAPVSSDKLRGSPVMAGAALIHTHFSPPLKDLAAYTNTYSINLYAESIFRAMAVKKGNTGDVAHAAQVVMDYWKAKGVDNSFIFLNDGSGLSPQNGMRPSFMTEVLYRMSADSSFQAFFSSLPVAGKSGTLSRFCKGTKAENRVFAKSGSLSRVLGYSGYIQGSDGRYYSFSILVNNFSGKSSYVSKKIEAILSAACGL